MGMDLVRSWSPQAELRISCVVRIWAEQGAGGECEWTKEREAEQQRAGGVRAVTVVDSGQCSNQLLVESLGA